MKIILIAALGKHFEIGEKNKLLWNLPEDMRHFRETTKNETVVMGRKTFESMGKPLPKRRNIVLSHNSSFSAEGIEVFANSEDIEHLKEERIFIMGGAEIYRLFLPKANEMILSRVDAEFPDADSFFPYFEEKEWNQISEKKYGKDAKNEFGFRIQILQRKTL